MFTDVYPEPEGIKKTFAREKNYITLLSEE